MTEKPKRYKADDPLQKLESLLIAALQEIEYLRTDPEEEHPSCDDCEWSFRDPPREYE